MERIPSDSKLQQAGFIWMGSRKGGKDFLWVKIKCQHLVSHLIEFFAFYFDTHLEFPPLSMGYVFALKNNISEHA